MLHYVYKVEHSFLLLFCEGLIDGCPNREVEHCFMSIPLMLSFLMCIIGVFGQLRVGDI